MYKTHLKKWEYVKNIRTEGRLDDHALHEALVETVYGSRSELPIADGRVVNRQKYTTHLMRKTRGSSYRKGSSVLQPVVIRPPEVFYVLESLLIPARAYIVRQHEDVIATQNLLTSRSTRLSPQVFDDMRSANRDHWNQWKHFAYSVKNALEEKKFNRALVLMRQAPKQLEFWMVTQPIEMLGGLLMFLTYCARFCTTLDKWREAEFLKVMKSLMRYGDQFAASELGMALSSSHPLRRILRVLSAVDNSVFKQAVHKTWKMALDTQESMLESPGSVEAIMDWVYLNTSTKEVELPPNFEHHMDETLRNLEARYGASHPKCMELLWRKAVFFIEKDEAQGVDPVLNEEHLVIMDEIIRRGANGRPRCGAFRFFADHHRARGEKEPALKNLRASINGLCEEFGEQDPLVFGFVSELKDWLLEWGDVDGAEKVDQWLEELQGPASDDGGFQLEVSQ